MSHLVRSSVLSLSAFALFSLAGCSDQSPYTMKVTEIKPASSNSANATSSSMEIDIVGNFGTSPCSAVQDQASITVTVESPRSTTLPIGPSLGARLTGYRVDYYYYDPNTGALSGPVSFLAVDSQNMSVPVNATSGDTHKFTFNIPLVSFAIKAWSVGAPYQGYAGYGGGRYVDRIVARVTVIGEDSTGKKLSGDGSMLLYFYDYGPGPSAPTDPILGPFTSSNVCYYQRGTSILTTPLSYWLGL